MNLQARVTHYRSRGFSVQNAVVNALLEETLQLLFATYPNTFVFFGGASLVLFYESPRLSADLDLLVLIDSLPDPETLVRILQPSLAGAAGLLGIPNVQVRAVIVGETHLKLAVHSEQQNLFTIDLSRISAVIGSAIVETSIGDSPAKARILSRDFLLFQKAESFLLRRNVKVRDVFDIRFLLEQGAVLDSHLRAHLSDGRASEILEDVDQIKQRIAQVTSSRCVNELQPVLPPAVYQELLKSQFEPLRAALHLLFAPWIEEA